MSSFGILRTVPKVPNLCYNQRMNLELFQQFISPECDRMKFIQTYLNSQGLEAPVIQLNGKNHIYVKFPLSQYNSMFKIKTVIAHYDRAAGTPGANDNSAAVFSILEWASRLNQCKTFHNIRIILTDGEEEGEAGVCDQGAFAVAEIFRRLNIVNDDIFVFDCMGRGCVPVICENNTPAAAGANFINRINELENKAEKIISQATAGRWYKLPTSYSDNASFLANGIPAVAITMLPSDEIDAYTKFNQTPKTWQLFHTQQDNLQSLTPQSFEITAKILDNLAQLKSLSDLNP